MNLKSNKVKFTFLIITILIVTAGLFFNAGQRGRKIIGFTNGHNAMCVGTIRANISTCAHGETCDEGDGWKVVATNKKIGSLFGRSSKKDRAGNDVAWSTMYRNAKAPANQCYNSMKGQIPTNDEVKNVIQNNDPRLYETPNKCGNRWNYAENRDWRKWVAKNYTSFGNFHADIVREYCTPETKYVLYDTVMRTAAKKPKQSWLEKKALSAANQFQSMAKDGINEAVQAKVCGAAAAAGAALAGVGAFAAGIACDFLYEKFIGDIVSDITEKILALGAWAADFLLETRTEGKASCRGTERSGRYMVYCSSPENTAASRPYSSCETNINEMMENRKNFFQEAHSKSEDYPAYRYIALRESNECNDRQDPDTGRLLEERLGEGVICSGSRNEFRYTACGVKRTRRNEISFFAMHLLKRCKESGHIDCSVRYGGPRNKSNCLEEKQPRMLDSGILETWGDQGRVRYDDLLPSEKRHYESRIKLIEESASCSLNFDWHFEGGPCNLSLCGRAPKNFERNARRKRKRARLKNTYERTRDARAAIDEAKDIRLPERIDFPGVPDLF